MDDMLPSDIEVVIRDTYHVSRMHKFLQSLVPLTPPPSLRTTSLPARWAWSGPC